MSDWPLLGPLQWSRYVTKQVRVKAGKDEEHRGWLLTVDPVSASLVLVNFKEEEGAVVQVVMGHAVEEVWILQQANEEITKQLHTCFHPPRTQGLDPEELKRRRVSIQKWLEKNWIPVEDKKGELRVAGVLTITAPYRPEDCCSSNQIILDRIQKLIQTLSQNPDHQETERNSESEFRSSPKLSQTLWV